MAREDLTLNQSKDQIEAGLDGGDVASSAGTVQEHQDVEKAEGDKPNLKEVRGQAIDYPEGGFQGWLTVAGAWTMLFCTFGYLNAFGVYQEFYSLHFLTNKSQMDISWIGSFQLFLLFSLGGAAGKLFDLGYFRPLCLVGSVIYVFSVFMTSLCKEYWQFFLAQGLCQGMGMGLVFLPSVGVVSHYFQRRRALAMGIVVSGSSLGGVAFPIMLNKLFNGSTGFANGVRASAYLILGMIIIANLAMRPRLPGRQKMGGGAPPDINFKAIITDKATICTASGMFFIMWGAFLPFFYVQIFALQHGISQNLSFYMLAIINGASTFGRTLPNAIADKIGPYNTMIPAATITGLLLFVWLAATNTAGLIVFCLIFGFASGAFVSLLAPVAASLARHPAEIGMRMGFNFLVVSIAGLTGTPICGTLLTRTNNHFWGPIIFAGISVFLGVFFLTLARTFETKRRGTQRL